MIDRLIRLANRLADRLHQRGNHQAATYPAAVAYALYHRERIAAEYDSERAERMTAH